jgi:ribosomal protein S7
MISNFFKFFLNCLIKRGKKMRAYNILLFIFDLLKKKKKLAEFFLIFSIKMYRPLMQIKDCIVGKTKYRIPSL